MNCHLKANNRSLEKDLSISLFLFPHQDDEYFVSPFLHQEQLGAHCFFLTNGQGHGIPEVVRNNESRRMLQRLNVVHTQLHFLPSTLQVSDKDLSNSLSGVFEWIVSETKAYKVKKIFCPACEGGHPDHDAAYLLGLALSKTFGAKVYAYATYGGHGLPYPLFSAMHLSKDSSKSHMKLSFRKRFFYSILFLFYPSQWKTWLGLAPQTIFKFWTRNQISILNIEEPLCFNLSLNQNLYYEKRGLSTKDTFLKTTHSFRQNFDL